MENQTNIIQFNKIKLLDNIATSIAYYGEQNGMSNFIDMLDLNCGAIPEGEYSQVIDVSAPQQFLKLYTTIAQSRFAYSVINVSKLGEKAFTEIRHFCHFVGANNHIEEEITLDQAFNTLNYFILDGMPEEVEIQITEKNENRIMWTQSKCCHKELWEKFNGNLFDYYQLLVDFVNGIFVNKKIIYKTDGNLNFSLSLEE